MIHHNPPLSHPQPDELALARLAAAADARPERLGHGR